MTSFHLENIFAVMCRIVGANCLTVDRTKELWYQAYRWDTETEAQFKKWMVDYLFKMPGAQSELYDRKHMRKDECIAAVDMFLLSYGWQTLKDWE